MTKVTVDKALLEQAIEALSDVLGTSHFLLRTKLRAALAKAEIDQLSQYGSQELQALILEKLAEPAVEPGASNCIECSNGDSWGLPDRPVCKFCVSGSKWQPLNANSINRNTSPPPPAVQGPPCNRGCNCPWSAEDKDGRSHCRKCGLISAGSGQ